MPCEVNNIGTIVNCRIFQYTFFFYILNEAFKLKRIYKNIRFFGI